MLESGGKTSVVSGRVKVDLTTPLEFFFKICIGLGCIGLPFVLLAWTVEVEIPLWLATIIFGAFFIGICGYRNTDNYYVVDAAKNCVFYHFSCFHIERDTVVARFKDVHAVSVHAVQRRSKHSSWWEYAVFIVLKSGKKIQVTNMDREALLERNLYAQNLAARIGAPFIKGQPESKLVVKCGRDGSLQVFVRLYTGVELATPMLLPLFAIFAILYFIRDFFPLGGP